MSKLRSQLDSLKRTQNPAGHNPAVSRQQNFAPSQSRSPTMPNPAQTQTRAELAEIRNSIQMLTQKIGEASTVKQTVAAAPVARADAPVDTAALATNLGNDLRNHLSGEIERMRSDLVSIGETSNKVSDQAVLDDINRITAGIRDLQDRKQVDPQHIDSILGNVNEMQGTIRQLAERPQGQIDESAISQAIQQSYQEIANRLDGIGHDHSAGKLDELNEKLESVKATLQYADPQVLTEIEGQLRALGESINVVAGQVSSSDAQVVEKVLPEYFENLDRRLNEITRAVVAATVNPSEEHQNSHERVEARLASLAKTIDQIALDQADARKAVQMPGGEGVPTDAFNAQFASLADQVAAIEGSISSLAVGGNSPDINPQINSRLEELAKTLERAINSGDGSVSQLEARISHLSDRLDEAMAMGEENGDNETEARIISEIQALSQRVENIDKASREPLEDHAGQLQSLEGQIMAISGQLGEQGNVDLSVIENRLSGIEAQVKESQDKAMEAAQEAVGRMSQNGADTSNPQALQSMENLSEDLKNLSQASLELKGHSLETFDAVRDSLAMILDRINGIESRLDDEISFAQSSAMSGATSTGHINDQAIQAAHEFATTIKNEPVQNVVPPSLDLQQAPDFATPTYDSQMPAQENLADAPIDTPLEPGSGAPDLAEAALDPSHEERNFSADTPIDEVNPEPGVASLMSHNNDRSEQFVSDNADPTDFIAAARRAAQAAARDASNVEPEQPSEKKAPKLGFLNGLLAKRKKPIVIAAAVALLAIIALPIAKSTLLGSSPAVEEQVAGQQVIPEEAIAEEGLVEEGLVEEGSQTLANSEVGVEAVQEPAKARSIDLGSPEQANANTPAGEKVVEVQPEQSVSGLDAMASMQALTTAPMPNPEAGSIALRQAAASGDPKAQYEIARRYTVGINGKPDFQKASEWYKLSAASGFAPAQYHLGNFFEKGHGVAADPDLAAQWYEKAAEGGNALAMHNLAVINAMGVMSSGADLASAVQWFEKAADHGVKDSQVNLGIVYTKGMGVSADLAIAYKWFAVAAKAGDKDAAQKRDTIAESMRPDQLEKARGEVELWRPAELDPGANSVKIPSEWNNPVQTTASLTSAQMISKVQSMLSKMGYKPGPADGVMGARTVSAIKQFQAKKGLTVDGKVGETLLKALDENA